VAMVPTPLQYPKSVAPAFQIPETLDSEYIKRKQSIGQRFLRLSDGRYLCYSVDGDASKGLPILAFHGGCESKCRFTQKESLPGVYLVAVDRPGYGGSSPALSTYTFESAIEDITCLVDHLHIADFVVLGHGVGAAWAQQVAAALPHCVRGAILWSSSPPLHPKASGELRHAIGYVEGIHCTTVPVEKDDFRALGLQQEKTKGPKVFQKFEADAFWVSAMVDSWRGCRNKTSILNDVSLTLATRWPHKNQDIKCPVFIYHGAGDTDVACPMVKKLLQKAIPQSEVEVIDGCGHIFSFGPDSNTQIRIQRAIAAMPALA